MNLSVLISVFSKEIPAYLAECLDSLAAQTLRAGEVVVVEDGPLGARLDRTIDAYREKLPIVSVRLKDHVGLGVALGAGLSACRGEYVARMDADDICVPDRFERQMDFLESHREVDVVGGAIAEFEQDRLTPHSIRMLPTAGRPLLEFAQFRNPLNHMTVVFRKAAVLAAGSYRTRMGFEDYDLWARMLMRGAGLHNLEDVLVYVRCGTGMQSRRGGISYLKREIDLQLRLREMRFLSSRQCAMNILLRAPVRLMPTRLRAMCYRMGLRNDPARAGLIRGRSGLGARLNPSGGIKEIPDEY
jgi:glycosyltransferase involved in cell wall biosynthesis